MQNGVWVHSVDARHGRFVRSGTGGDAKWRVALYARNGAFFPLCAQILKNMTFVAGLLRALHRATLSCFSKPENVSKPCFFQCPVFLKNPLLFKNITCCSPIPRHMQKHFLKGLKTMQHYRSSWATTV